MFGDLLRYLGWTQDFPQSEVLLVLDEGSNSGFLTHHFISCFLNESLPVCLVSTRQTFAHYAQVGTKIGANLDKACNDGNFKNVDIMSLFLQHNLEPYKCEWSAKHIYQCVKEEISKLMKNHATALLIIDDVSVFSSLFPESDVNHFLHYIRTLSKTMQFSIVLTMPKLICEQALRLQCLVTHYANTVLSVKPLQTGYSKDVHGQLEILKGAVSSGVKQYKLSDKNLRLFAVGTSMAVL